MIGVVGQLVRAPLSRVQANDWNPNRMSARQMASLRWGFEHEGWLSSQALLIWGKDDKGKARNIIIDGEHRWRLGVRLGMSEGPMVFLDGLTEAQAKALTIKLDNKRGTFDPERLSSVLRTLEGELSVPDLSLELGFEQEEYLRHLSFIPQSVGSSFDDEKSDAPPPPSGGTVVSQNVHTKVVPLYLTDQDHAAFGQLITPLMKRFKTTNVSETVLASLRRALKRR